MSDITSDKRPDTVVTAADLARFQVAVYDDMGKGRKQVKELLYQSLYRAYLQMEPNDFKTLCESCNLHYNNVMLSFRKRGLKTRPRGRRLGVQSSEARRRDAEIVKMRVEGHSIMEIGRIHGISHQRVSQILKKVGRKDGIGQ